MSLKLSARVQYRGKSKNKIGENRRPSFEFKGGDEFSRNRNKFVKRHYRIDRENDTYAEKIVDPESGENIVDKNEKLSSHIDHGSAKIK